MILIIYGDPKTKKNSQRIITRGKYPKVLPSKAYEAYEADCLRQLNIPFSEPRFDTPVNLFCRYHMRTRRRVDLVNLLEATCDILVKARILEDDNSGIIRSVDGSGVYYDKECPRVEIEITRAGGEEHGDHQEGDPEGA